MVSKTKKIIIILIILLICIIAIVIVRKIIDKKNTSIVDEVEELEGWDYFDPSKIERVQFRSDYILVEKCIRKYIENYSDEEYINKILADEYIKLHNISLQRGNEQSFSLENSEILITNMYVTEIGLGVYFYYVDGNMVNTQTMETQKFELGVIIDSTNTTFGIIPQEYLIKMGYSGLNENSKVTFKETSKIKNKEVNTFKYKFIDEETYIVDYLFPDFINKCLLSSNIAYQYLDNEYKEKKFGNIESFQQFINNNKELYETQNPQNIKKPNEFSSYNEYLTYFYSYEPLGIASYEIKNMGEYIQYALIDNLGNYYIFREKGTMNYKVILDTYTLVLPEFVEQYSNADAKTKTALNIQNIVEALNDEDYKYVYSKLADSFKANYFNTLESFKEYAKNTFGTDNKVEYKKFIETANYCTFDITLKNEKKELTKTIIMQLLEGTDFVMSFNVD